MFQWPLANSEFPFLTSTFIAWSGQLQLQDLLPLEILKSWNPSLKYQEAENNPRGLFRVIVLQVLSSVRAPGFVAGNYYL